MKFRSTFRGHEIEDREINRRNSVCTTKFGPTIVGLENLQGVCSLRSAFVGGGWAVGSNCGRGLSLGSSPANANVNIGARIQLI